MKFVSIIGVSALAALTGAASAGTFTGVNLGAVASSTRGSITGGLTSSAGHLPSNEGGGPNSIVNIMARMYTGSTSLAGVTGSIEGTINFGNGITATRVFDGGAGGPLQLHMGAAGKTDQVWQDGVVTFAARARYAGYAQHFGYRTGTGAGGFAGADSILDIASQGFFASGPESTLTIGSPVDFQWMRSNNNAGTSNPQYSRDANNWQGRDQMVTWEIFGAGTGERRYVVGFEDINQGGNPDDRDFNDLVIELSVVVPLPSAGGMALAGLCVLGARRRRRTA